MKVAAGPLPDGEDEVVEDAPGDGFPGLTLTESLRLEQRCGGGLTPQ